MFGDVLLLRCAGSAGELSWRDFFKFGAEVKKVREEGGMDVPELDCPNWLANLAFLPGALTKRDKIACGRSGHSHRIAAVTCVAATEATEGRVF